MACQLGPRRPAVTVTKRLGLWLNEVRGSYCDDCLAKELKLPRRQEANRIAIALSSKRNFLRERRICCSCGAERKVIQAI